MDEWILGICTCVALAYAVAPTPRTAAPRLLAKFGVKAAMEFPLDGSGRLAAGRSVEVALTSLVWRLNRCWAWFATGLSLSGLLLLVGPPLSRSDVTSLATALAVCLAVVAPYVVARPFLQPCAVGGGAPQRQPVGLEDYLHPARRVLLWVAGLSVVAIPVGAAVLAGSSGYEGARFFWEGLVGLPVAVVAVLVATEVQSRRVRDSGSDASLVHLWDSLRERALRMLATVVTLGAVVSWNLAAQGLVGVALVRPSHLGWLGAVEACSRAVRDVLVLAALVQVLTPAGRSRRRLWPGLAPDARVRWGTAPADERSSSR